MYGANNYGYNPYGNYMMPRQIQQPLQNTTENYQPLQNTAVQSRTALNGKIVDGIDTVKGIDIPLDGSVSYFPLASGEAIVTKQLQMDGTSKITVFKPIQEEKNTIKYITEDDMKKAINGIDLSELEDIKEELKDLKQEFKEFKKNKKKEE